MNKVQPIIIKGLNPSDIRWKNFAGKVTDRNQYGKRQFALFLDPEMVDIQALIDEGWKIKTREYDGTDKPTEYYINVDLNYNYNEPPEIDLIINAEDGGQPHGVHLTEEDVYQLDDVVFTACNIIVRGWWSKNKFTGEWTLKASLARLQVWSNPDHYRLALEDFDNEIGDVIFDQDDALEEAIDNSDD